MRNVRIEKNKLQEAVQKNRDAHRGEFEKACEDYKGACVHYLEKQIEQVKAGVIVEQYMRIPQPEDHTEDYDRILRMLEMSEDEIIELNEPEFAQYVMDDWGWKGNFYASSATLAAAPKS